MYWLMLLILLMASPVTAATYWVHGNLGNNGNACTNSATPLTTTAKQTIQAGFACLAAGDTLRIRAGTYTEGFNWINVVHGSSGARITVEATSGEAVTWRVPSGSQLAVDVTSHFFTLRGITFDGSTGSNCLHHSEGVCGNPSPGSNPYTTIPVSGSGMLITVGGTDNLVENCEFTGSAYGVMLLNTSALRFTFRNNHVHQVGKVWNANIMYLKAPNTIIEGSRFFEVTGGAIGFWNADTGAQVVNDAIARNNYIERSGYFWAPTNQNGTRTDTGAQITQGTINTSHGAGISFSRGARGQAYNNTIVNTVWPLSTGDNVSDCKFFNNTIMGNVAAGLIDAPGIWLGGTNCQARNNIVYQPGITTPAPIFSDGPGNSLSNNLCSSSSGGLCQIVGNPNFVGSAGGNFQLAAGSPAVNAGADLSSSCPACVTDQIGTPRAAGQWDIGALERATAPSPDPVTNIAWWKLDEGTGTTAADSSGNGHTGTLDSAAWGPGIIFPSAFKPTGTQEITVANTTGLNRTTSISVNGWFLPGPTGGGDCALLSNQEVYSLYLNGSGQPFGLLWNGSGFESTNGPTSILGAPHMITLTYDSGVASPTMRLYVDAVQVGTRATGSAMVYNQPGGAFRIGAGGGSSPSFQCPATFQQIRLYSGQLDQAGITALYNDLVPQLGMHVTHGRYATADQALGTFPVAVDTDYSLVVGTPFRIRWALHKSDTGSLTEYFRVFARTFTSGAWNAWTEVGNTLGTLGVRFYTDSAVNLGDVIPLPAALPLDGFTEVVGKVIADTVDVVGPTYDAIQRLTIAQGQHAEYEAALVTGNPLIPGNLLQLRVHRENGAPFCPDCYGGPASTAIRTLTLGAVLPPSNVRLGGVTSGGTSQ